MALAAGTYAVFSTTEGKITVRLFETDAPITVKNFIELAEGSKEWTHPVTRAKSTDKLYDGTIFHRVIPDFMIQGGDPAGTGMGGPGYRFEDETKGSPHKFDKPGKLAMANSGPNTNGSQFFITVAPTPWLTGNHTIFGEVVEGQDIVTKSPSFPRRPGQAPQARRSRVGRDRARRLEAVLSSKVYSSLAHEPIVPHPSNVLLLRSMGGQKHRANLQQSAASNCRSYPRTPHNSRIASPNFSTLAGPIPSIASSCFGFRAAPAPAPSPSGRAAPHTPELSAASPPPHATPFRSAPPIASPSAVRRLRSTSPACSRSSSRRIFPAFAFFAPRRSLNPAAKLLHHPIADQQLNGVDCPQL